MESPAITKHFGSSFVKGFSVILLVWLIPDWQECKSGELQTPSFAHVALFGPKRKQIYHSVGVQMADMKLELAALPIPVLPLSIPFPFLLYPSPTLLYFAHFPKPCRPPTFLNLSITLNAVSEPSLATWSELKNATWEKDIVFALPECYQMMAADSIHESAAA